VLVRFGLPACGCRVDQFGHPRQRRPRVCSGSEYGTVRDVVGRCDGGSWAASHSVMFIRCAERDRLQVSIDEAVQMMSECAIESTRIAVRNPCSSTLSILKSRFEAEKEVVKKLRTSLESHRREHGC
jgi:hypothetical protein